MNSIEHLYENYDVELLIEDFGLNGWDMIKDLDIDTIDQDYEDYRKDI
jgi:hypothetical protein